MTDEIKRLDIGEFREAGYLQEVNRRVLHPLGLALEVEVDGWGDRDLVRAKLRQAMVDGQEPTEREVDAVQAFLHATGLDQQRISGVWDYRDDPEGINYDWRAFDHGVVRGHAARIQSEWADKAQARQQTLGYVVQPLP